MDYTKALNNVKVLYQMLEEYPLLDLGLGLQIKNEDIIVDFASHKQFDDFIKDLTTPQSEYVFNQLQKSDVYVNLKIVWSTYFRKASEEPTRERVFKQYFINRHMWLNDLLLMENITYTVQGVLTQIHDSILSQLVNEYGVE